MHDRHAIDVGDDAARLRAVEERGEGRNGIPEHPPGTHCAPLDDVRTDKPRRPRVGRDALETLLIAGDERDVRRENAPLPLQGDEPLIPRRGKIVGALPSNDADRDAVVRRHEDGQDPRIGGHPPVELPHGRCLLVLLGVVEDLAAPQGVVGDQETSMA